MPLTGPRAAQLIQARFDLSARRGSVGQRSARHELLIHLADLRVEARFLAAIVEVLPRLQAEVRGEEHQREHGRVAPRRERNCSLRFDW